MPSIHRVSVLDPRSGRARPVWVLHLEEGEFRALERALGALLRSRACSDVLTDSEDEVLRRLYESLPTPKTVTIDDDENLF